MARQRKHNSYRNRRGRFGLLHKLLSVAAVAAAIVVACVVFFRVNRIEVTGNQRYTKAEIIEASGIQIGDNLIALSKGRVVANIFSKLPYVESVVPRRILPDGVLLEVRERAAAASVDSDEGRWLISSQGKLLEPAQDSARVVRVTGLTALAPYAGGSLQVEEEKQTTLRYVLELLSALEEHGMLSDCTELDCTSASCLAVEYGIYHLRLPRGGNYDYYLSLLESALASEKMPQDTPGTQDLTIEDGRVHFIPDR